jgi:NADPH:quinone reductase-like Zn-dependent oxidoreductase
VLIVNPLTAVAFLDIARGGRHAAIVNNAAASALGRMIIRLGRRSGITTISIVRRHEHVGVLKALGADYVLNSDDVHFPSTLRDLAHRVRATLAFDAVGGAQTRMLVEAMPFGSTVVVYAGLTGEPSTFDALALAGEQKTITGFYLPNWMAARGLPALLRDIRRVQHLVATDLQTAIRDRFPLSAAQTALDMYEADMTAGKVLLVADPEQVSMAAGAHAA